MGRIECESVSLLIRPAAVNELVSHLPLQMLLYFNMFYFPSWWFSEVFMLELKVGDWRIQNLHILHFRRTGLTLTFTHKDGVRDWDSTRVQYEVLVVYLKH